MTAEKPNNDNIGSDLRLSSSNHHKNRSIPPNMGNSQQVNFPSLEPAESFQSHTQQLENDNQMTFALNTAVNSSNATSVRRQQSNPAERKMLEEEFARLKSLHHLRASEHSKLALFPPISQMLPPDDGNRLNTSERAQLR